MFRRLLLDPTPAEGGGAANPTPAPAPQPTPTPTPTLPPQPQPPQSVTVPYAEFQALASLPARLATMEAERSASVQAEKDRATQALLRAGQAEEAVKKVREDKDAELGVERQARLTAEGRAKNFARDTALSLALANHKIRPGTAPLLVKL